MRTPSRDRNLDAHFNVMGTENASQRVISLLVLTSTRAKMSADRLITGLTGKASGEPQHYRIVAPTLHAPDGLPVSPNDALDIVICSAEQRKRVAGSTSYSNSKFAVLAVCDEPTSEPQTLGTETSGEPEVAPLMAAGGLAQQLSEVLQAEPALGDAEHCPVRFVLATPDQPASAQRCAHKAHPSLGNYETPARPSNASDAWSALFSKLVSRPVHIDTAVSAYRSDRLRLEFPRLVRLAASAASQSPCCNA